MRRRLYFLLPNVNKTRETVNELLLAHVDFDHIHVMARNGTPMKDLPEASIIQKSNMIYGLERGLLIGGFTGILAGIIASLSPTLGLGGGGLILACAFAGAAVGAWSSSMIGSDNVNYRIKSFEKSIEEGQLLLMVDVPKNQVDAITQMVKSHHPEARIERADPTIPAFP
ncbi:MAG: DUF1269 domain-containing protein [Gammaproteobacteria bacterium]|nr:DUF1269 domain-containing protein [Gammaproteobacteria bacterium]